MLKNKKSNKDSSSSKDSQNNQGSGGNACPKKEGDNCLVPGVFSDSDPIGGG